MIRHFDFWPVALRLKIHLDTDDNHPPTSDGPSIVGSSAPRHTQDMERKTSKRRKLIAELADLLFRLEYYTQLWMIKVRNDLLAAFVRGSTHIQRAMTRSAGLVLDRRAQGTVEPVVVRSHFHPTLSPVIKRRRSATRLPFGGE